MKLALHKLKYQFDLLRHKIDENEEITLNVKTYVRHIDEENSSEYPYMRQKEVDIGSIKIFKKDTADTLAKRILKQEHIIYPKAILKILANP